MTDIQRKSYTEMLEIINNIKLLKSQIPKSLIEEMEKEKDKEWTFKYDKTISLKEQNILYDTKVLYSYLYTEYIADDETRKKLENEYRKNSYIKYNPDNLFKKKKKEINNEPLQLVVVKENFIVRILKKIFRR